MANAGAPLRKIGGWLFPVAVCVTLGLGVWFDFYGRFVSAQVRDARAKYQGIDEQMISASQGDGVFLHFTGFVGPLNNWVPLDYYERAVFSLYPRRVLVADPGTAIFDFDQLAASNFDPDAAWMLRNGTPVEVTFARDEQTGDVAYTVQHVSGAPAAR
jgi:hypothetical protein